MKAPLLLWLMLASATAHAAETDQAHTLVARTLAAIGGARDVHAIAAIRAEATVVNYDVVENDHLGPPYPFAGASRASLLDDLHGDRRLLTERPVAAPGTTVRTWLEGSRQWLETADAGGRKSAVLLEALPAWETHDPLRALLLAEHADDLALEPDVVVHEAPQHVLAFHHGRYPVRIFIDALSGLPSATEATIAVHRATSSDVAWNGWGDLRERTEYSNWDIADGVRYPLQWDIFRNGAALRVELRDQVHVDGTLDAGAWMAPPATSQSLPVTLDELGLGQAIVRAPNPARPIAEIAPGVVQIPGSWYSTLVRQDDGVVVIDAPISAGYARRVLAEAARRFPGVPVKAVISSTGFFWHFAGLREYAARGIPIYARDRNVPLVQRMLAAPHTLYPDDLARAPRAAVVHAVSARTTIGHGRNAIVLWPVRYGEQPMLMSSIADAHLLHTAEMVQPLGPRGALILPEALLELRQSMQDAKLSGAGLRLIGMHMSPTPWSTVEAAIAAAGR